MLIKGLLLEDDADLDYAIHFKSNVAVIQSDKVIGRGRITSYTKDAVRMQDGYYLRTNSEFRTE